MTKQLIIATLIGLYLITAAKLSIVYAGVWQNPKTGDNGVELILREPVYNLLCNTLCALHLDDRGAIGDIKIPVAKQSYIVFEL